MVNDLPCDDKTLALTGRRAGPSVDEANPCTNLSLHLRAPIAMIGMPGSGKSTIGKAVAKRLALPFTDCDKAIESRAGVSITRFFERHGEAAFRDLEADVIESLVSDRPSLIATGGGIVLRPANRELLRTRACAVYLRASTELLWRRVRRDGRRPLLQVADPEQRLQQMRAERGPLYEETATIVIDTDALPFDRLVDEVVRRLEEQAAR